MKNDKVVFFKDDHSYWLGDQQIPSVGKFTGRFYDSFEDSFWKTHITLKRILGEEYMDHYRSFKKFQPDAIDLFEPILRDISPIEFHKVKKVVDDEWTKKRNKANFNGTKFHNLKEEKAYLDGFLINPFDGKKYPVTRHKSEFDNETITLDFMSLPDGGYLEMLVVAPDFSVAGQSDEVYIETIDGVRYIDINDTKTNEKKPAKSSLSYYLPPLDYMYASTHNKYAIQINSYAHILSLYGFVPRNLGYTHYKKYDENSGVLQVLPVMKKEIEIIFDKNLHF